MRAFQPKSIQIQSEDYALSSAEFVQSLYSKRHAERFKVRPSAAFLFANLKFCHIVKPQ